MSRPQNRQPLVAEPLRVKLAVLPPVGHEFGQGQEEAKIADNFGFPGILGVDEEG